LARCACEIDLAADEIRLFPAAAMDARAVAWRELTLLENVPLAPARFAGGEGLFRIDVGAAGGPAANVIFYSPTVTRLKLADERTPVVTSMESRFGVGQIPWFELAGHRFETPDVLFALDPTGPLADPYLAGNLGVEFLKPFRLILDYPHHRVAFVPREFAE
jgi:hypothetical protein